MPALHQTDRNDAHEPDDSRAEEIGEASEGVRDELEEVLSYHGGDALAAVRTLLDDCRHLRGELAVTEAALSRGMVRGWRPNYER